MKETTTFIKLCGTKYIKSLIKEAKRVGYRVTKDDISVIVQDEVDDALVFKSIRVNYDMWGTTFSKLYWQDNALDTLNK